MWGGNTAILGSYLGSDIHRASSAVAMTPTGGSFADLQVANCSRTLPLLVLLVGHVTVLSLSNYNACMY